MAGTRASRCWYVACISHIPFRRQRGRIAHTYPTEAWLEIAKQLLSKGQPALAAIAVHTSFHSQPHFTHVFRKSTGTTPERWRARVMPPSTGTLKSRATSFTPDAAH